MQALGSRATLVRVHQRAVAGLHPKKGGFVVPQGPMLVGVQVDPTAALQLRDIGPAADNLKAAAQFRQFWGDKAELRRFQVSTQWYREQQCESMQCWRWQRGFAELKLNEHCLIVIV